MDKVCDIFWIYRFLIKETSLTFRCNPDHNLNPGYVLICITVLAVAVPVTDVCILLGVILVFLQRECGTGIGGLTRGLAILPRLVPGAFTGQR